MGCARAEQGGNLIVKEQWLENPTVDIYVLLDCGGSGANCADVRKQ